LDWNNINKDKDTSGLGPIEYDQSKVPALIRKHADNVRGKSYGQQVREAQARNAEYAGLIAQEANDIAKDTETRQYLIETRYDVAVGAMTEGTEILDARVDPFGNVFENLKKRIDIRYYNLNVKAFGAVGDGTTDDAPAIQRAIDALSLVGTGTIEFPSGNYLIGTQINYKQNVSLQSIGGATLIRKSGMTGAIIKSVNIDNVNISGINFDGIDKTATNLYIVGGFNHRLLNIVSYNATNGIYVEDASEYIVKDCTVHDCKYYGITASAATLNCHNVILDNNKVYNCRNSEVSGADTDGVGIYVKGIGENETKFYINNVRVVNNDVRNNGRSGITILAVIDFIVNNNFANGHTLNTSIGAGIIISAASKRGVVKDNFTNENYNGIILDVATAIAGESANYGDFLVEGNTVFGNINSAIRNHNAPRANIVDNNLNGGRTGIFLNQYAQMSNVSKNRIVGFKYQGIVMSGNTTYSTGAQSDILIEDNFIYNCGTDTADTNYAGIYIYSFTRVKLSNNTFIDNLIDLRLHSTATKIDLIFNKFSGGLNILKSASVNVFQGLFRENITTFTSTDFNSDGKTEFILPADFTIPHFGLNYIPVSATIARTSSITTAIRPGYVGQKIYLVNILDPIITIKHNAGTSNIGKVDISLSKGQAVEYTYFSNGWVQTSNVLTTGI